MNMQPVKSSNIVDIGYDVTRLVMRVHFKESTYEYQGIAPSLYADMMAAKSIGSYFARNIKPRYEGIEIVGDRRAA